MIKKLVERKRTRGGFVYAIFSHSLRAAIGQGIHTGKNVRTRFGSESKRRERLRHNLFD